MTKNKIGIWMLFVLLFSAGVNAQNASDIRINEVLVINEDNFLDDYGKRNAWIELYNTSAGSVDIKGCYLTNDKNNPTKYPIPKGDVLTVVKPRQHTLFWADGQPGRGTFHVNFTLDPNKENYIALFDADGKTLIDEVTIPAGQRADISYGRVVDGEDTWGILSKVTPSTNNVTLDSNEKIENFKRNDSFGIGMTITAMFVVFCALLLLYVIFKNIGKAAIRASKRNMKKSGDDTMSTRTSAYTGEIIAAISAALHEVNEDAHDIEDTVLTIKKVTRAYSPWSSKIYTLRDTPKK